MKTETFTHTASDGAAVFVHHWSPDYEIGRAIVLLLHGMSEHAGRYADFAEELTSAGYQVFAHDQRGHGRTAPGDADFGFVADHDGWQRLVADTLELCTAARQRYPGRPLYLFSHSMGTYIAQDILCRHSELTGPAESEALINAAIMSGANGSVGLLTRLGRLIARFERLRQGRRGRSDLINALSFGAFNREFAPNRTSYDWLSRDEQSVDRYISDPFCGFLSSNQFWVDLLDAVVAVARPENRARICRELPIYIFSGRADPVNRQGRGAEELAETYRKMGIRNVSYRIYPRARHETLHELNRDEVVGHVLEWLDCLRVYQKKRAEGEGGGQRA